MRKQATLWLSLVVCLPGLAFAQLPATDADALARQVIAALTAKDQGTLESLSIDRTEFKKYVWPTIASRVPGGQTNADNYYAAEPEITLRTDSGQEQVFQLGSGLLEHEGSIKVASYYRAPGPSGATQ